MKKADPSAVKVWRLAAGIWTCALLLFLGGLIALKHLLFSWLPSVLMMVLGVLILVQAVWFIYFAPLIAYRTHRYQMNDTELVTLSGVVVKKKTVIPFVRIQNVETHIGPIMKRFHLKTVEVTTAGGGTTIELISAAEADHLKSVIDEAVARLERRRL